MPLASNGTISIHYETRGDGPPLLLLMGWQGNRTWWPESLLSRLEPHFRLILMDHRGTGRSGDSPGLYTLGTLARDAIAVLDTLGIERAHVLGVSMGGMVAQELALCYPERLRHLTLMSTTARPGIIRGLSKEQQQAWFGYLLQRDRTFQEFLLDMLFSRDVKANPTPAIEGFLERRNNERTPKSTVLRQYLALQMFNSRRRLKRIKSPTLVITGSNDLIIAAHHAHDLQKRIPGAQLHEVHGGSHAMLDTEAEELADVIVTFLHSEDQYLTKD